MANLTAKQINDLNRMNVNATRGSLGSRINALETSSPVYLSGVTLTGYSTAMYETTPVLGTATYIHTAVALTGVTQTITTFTHQPDVPRLLVISGNALNEAGNVVITGKDFAGVTIIDTIALNAATPVPGVKVFASVTSIVFPALTNPGDTVTVGVLNKIGFPIAVPYSYLFIDGLLSGAHDAGSLTAAVTVGGSYYTPAGALDGIKKLDLYFESPR